MFLWKRNNKNERWHSFGKETTKMQVSFIWKRSSKNEKCHSFGKGTARMQVLFLSKMNKKMNHGKGMEK